MYIDKSGTRQVLNSKSIDIAIRDVSEEIDTAMNKQVENANISKMTASLLFGDNSEAQAWVYLIFYSLVNHEEPWDIKRQESWEMTIGTQFPGKDQKVLYHGLVMTPENLGNYTYGFLGYAYGIPYDHLLIGSYYAAGFPTSGDALANEIVLDWGCILLGYRTAQEFIKEV